jgi:hypothetical protein
LFMMVACDGLREQGMMKTMMREMRISSASSSARGGGGGSGPAHTVEGLERGRCCE